MASGAAAAEPAVAAIKEPPSAVEGWRDAASCERLMAAFDRDGYCVIKGALDDAEVAEITALLADMRPRLEASPHRKRVDICDNGRAVPGLDVRCMVTQARPRCAAGGAGIAGGEDDVEYPFLRLMDHPAAFPVALRALGNPNISLLTSHLICSPPVSPEAGRNIGWHTDGGSPQFAHVDGVRAFQQLKIGYYLVDLLDEDMGSLMVVPGSHRRPAIGHRAATDPDPPGAVQLKLRKGDAVVFQQGLWHAGGLNRSQQVRVALYFGYGARYLRPMDFVPDTLPASFVAKLSPVQQQLMGLSSSPLGYYIPRPEDVPLRERYRQHFGVDSHRL